MTIARCEASLGRAVAADCDRAAGWLCALDTELPAAGAPSQAWLALGLAIGALAAASSALAAEARERAARRLDAFAESFADGASGADPYVAALAFAAMERRPDPATRSWIASPSARARSAVRQSLARRLAEVAHDAVDAPRWDDAVEHALLHGEAGDVADLADTVEALGVRDLSADGRRRLAAAAAARGFAALRGHRGFALGTALLRVHAAHADDAIGSGYAVDYLRRQQQLDGSFGHLPARSVAAGDIRLAFHLPRTVLAVWTMHDAGAEIGFVRRMTPDAG